MYKLNLGLSYSILKLIYMPHNQYTHILDKIQQHRIILSERLIQYYIESTPDEYRDVIQSYLDTLIYADSCHIYMESIEGVSIEDEIVSLVEKNPMKVLIGYEDEFCKELIKKRVKLITPEDIRLNKINSFYRYTLPISNHIALQGEKCEAYATWFGHLWENEKEVIIIDGYIFNNNGIESFKKYYLPFVGKETKISIYCTELENIKEKDIVDEITKDDYLNWDIEVHLCRKFHERYIVFGDNQISIGVGVDFLHRNGYVRENCTINISKLNTSVIPINKEIKKITN